MTDFEPIVDALRERARAGDSPIQLARVLVELAQGEFRPMAFIATFRMAFGVPIQELHESVSWVGFGGLDVEDEEFTERLAPHIEAWRKSQPS